MIILYSTPNSPSQVIIQKLNIMKAAAAAVLVALAHRAVAQSDFCPFAGIDPPETQLPEGHAPVPLGSTKGLHGGLLMCPHLKASADPGQKTFKGCTCKSSCGATLDFGNSKCDWCYTEGNCGHYSILRLAYYDYCDYSKIDDYEAKTWQEKHADTWAKVTADKTTGKYPNLAGIFAESVMTSFDNFREEMPAGRVKYIHSIGAMCQIKTKIASDSPFTGLLEANAQISGMVRMGGAAPLSKTGIVPGIGWKFYRTGVVSADFVSLWKLTGTGASFDFFAVNQTNHVPKPSDIITKIGGQKFSQASNCVNAVGLSDLCQYNQDGKKSSKLVFPYKLLFVPQIHLPSSPTTQEGMNARLESIKKGTTIYKMMSLSSPKATWQYLGDIVTDSECTMSNYGDNKLFFRHQRFEDDLKLRPEWINEMDASECFPKAPTSVAPASCADEKASIEF
mmetsp:Transcript_23977/g.58038  ORF Transcript_23977/g.58038 Transcript_23977/m.58038 type:complete len:450 (+) Transcript_23977:2-1351(+)